MKNESQWITTVIKDFVTESPLNDMGLQEPLLSVFQAAQTRFMINTNPISATFI